jgi:hypothetical protein
MDINQLPPFRAVLNFNQLSRMYVVDASVKWELTSGSKHGSEYAGHHQ